MEIEKNTRALLDAFEGLGNALDNLNKTQKDLIDAGKKVVDAFKTKEMLCSEFRCKNWGIYPCGEGRFKCPQHYERIS